MCLFATLLLCLFFITDVSNTVFLRSHEHQSAFRVRRNIGNRTSCILPDQPSYGFWKFLELDEKAKITLEFGCNAGYKLSSNFKYMVCTPYGWVPPVPRKCFRMCPPLLSTNEVTFTCKNKGVEVPCDEATDNTTASFECAQYFKPVDRTVGNHFCWEGQWNKSPPPCMPEMCPPIFSTKQMTATCENNGVTIRCDEATENTIASFQCAPYLELADRVSRLHICSKGKWNQNPPECQPVCGEKRVTTTPLIVNGQAVNKGDYSWSTAIFRAEDNEKITHICGGTILTQRVILTAAHCVTDDHGRPIPKEKMIVGVGKYYNKYKDPRDTDAQYSNVNKVVVHENYSGSSLQYANDIALLITQDKLLLSSAVQPICYQGLPKFQVEEGFIGVITGWDLTSNNSTYPADELLETPLVYSPQSNCLRELPEKIAEEYVTSDKFCARPKENGIALSEVEAGAGLVFKYYETGRYYVRGVVSTCKLDRNDECDTQGKTFFTDVTKHYEWLQEHVEKYDKL